MNTLNRKDHAVLMVDDEKDSLSIYKTLFSEAGLQVQIVDPNEVTRDQILDANVVIVDFELKQWEHELQLLNDTNGAIGRIPPDGLALASVLRRHVQANEKPPTAFVILTGQIGKLADPLPGEYRNHALARLNNLEWVFEKGKGTASFIRQIKSLDEAILALPTKWLPDEEAHSFDTLLNLLKAGVKVGDVEGVALIDDVSRCLPPLHEISEWSHGITVLRWLMHRIFPYPSFLFDSQYLAARLGLAHEALVTELNDAESFLSQFFSECKYNGILRDFVTPRWWRQKVESLLWEHVEGRSSNLDSVRQFVFKQSQKQLPLSNPLYHPVVCIGEDYCTLPNFASIDDAVRLQPDDWPSFAESAWASIQQVKESQKLRSLVIEADKERLWL